MKYLMEPAPIFSLTGDPLFRIIALKDFADVRKGDLGGFVSTSDNLSQEGNCWVYGNARVFQHAKVSGDARITGNTLIYGYAQITGKVLIHGNVQVFGDAKLTGAIRLWGNALVSRTPTVSTNGLHTDTHVFKGLTSCAIS